MSMELFLPQYRGIAGAMLEVFWGVTVVMLAGVAYLFQHWRYIQLAVTLPSLLALGYFWYVSWSALLLKISLKENKNDQKPLCGVCKDNINKRLSRLQTKCNILSLGDDTLTKPGL